MSQKTEEQLKQEMIGYVREKAIAQVECALLSLLGVSHQLLTWVDPDEVISTAKQRVAVEAAEVRSVIDRH